MTTQDKIAKAVSEAKNFPNATIEHSFEFYKDTDNFDGVKAVFNKEVKNTNGYQVVYRY